jgi:hypothetical protein
MNYGKATVINVKPQIRQYTQVTIIISSASNVRKETLLKFYKLVAIPYLPHEHERWTLRERQKIVMQHAHPSHQHIHIYCNCIFIASWHFLPYFTRSKI